MRIKWLCVLALGLIICLPGVALAWTSLDQGYFDNYPNAGQPTVPVDKLEFFITSGAVTFDAVTPLVDYGEQSGYAGFTGWTVTILSPTHVVATNADAPVIATWAYQFTGNNPVPDYTLFWNAYDNGVFQYGEIVQLTNGGLYFPVPGNYSYDAPFAVPLPPSVLLLGSGLLGLGLLGRRRRLR